MFYTKQLSVIKTSQDNLEKKMALRLSVASHKWQLFEISLTQSCYPNGVNNCLIYFHNTCYELVNAFFSLKLRWNAYKIITLLAALSQAFMHKWLHSSFDKWMRLDFRQKIVAKICQFISKAFLYNHKQNIIWLALPPLNNDCTMSKIHIYQY